MVQPTRIVCCAWAEAPPSSAHAAHAAAMPRLNAFAFILNAPYPDFLKRSPRQELIAAPLSCLKCPRNTLCSALYWPGVVHRRPLRIAIHEQRLLLRPARFD